jgi:hypothetical protein
MLPGHACCCSHQHHRQSARKLSRLHDVLFCVAVCGGVGLYGQAVLLLLQPSAPSPPEPKKGALRNGFAYTMHTGCCLCAADVVAECMMSSIHH